MAQQNTLSMVLFAYFFTAEQEHSDGFWGAFLTEVALAACALGS